MADDLPSNSQVAFWRHLPVRTDRDTVAEFASSLSRVGSKVSGNQPDVPLTFAAYWLSLPEIQEKIIGSLSGVFDPESDIILHLEQTIEAREALQVERNYLLDLKIGQPYRQRSFELLAEVRDLEGVIQLSLSSRIVMHKISGDGHA